MAELTELLREAVGDLPTSGGAAIDDIVRRAHRRRRRQRVGGVMTTVAVVVAAAVGVLSSDDRSAVEVVGQPDAAGQRVFSSPTDVVLLFDDGYDGVTALDLDTGVVGRRVVEGQRAGDPPHRLFRAGDSLVVGWGEVFAAPLDGGRSVSLGEATTAVPAAEPGRVWLATWSEGSPGSGPLTMRLVDLEGRVVETLTGAGAGPMGVSGGVVFDPPEGAYLVLSDTDDVTGFLGDTRVLAAGRDRYVTCDGPCDRLTVLQRGTPGYSVPVPPGITLVDTQAARSALSPDGSRLAAVAGSPAGARLVVVDVGTGQLLVDEPVDNSAYPVWSPDGSQLFWSTYSYQEATTLVVRYAVESGVVESRRLPFGGALRPVALHRSEAAAFLPAQPGTDPEACPPPTLQPSYRTGLCGFRVTGGGDVVVPDVVGQDLTSAESQLAGLGVTLSVREGDPRDVTAIVVVQEPAGGTLAPRGASVAVRTTVIDPRVCAVLAHATVTGDVLRQVRPVAPAGLAADIDTLLGLDPALRGGMNAPHVVAGRAAGDRIDVAVQACSRS